MSSMIEQVVLPDPKVTNCLEKYGISYRVFNCDPELADTATFCSHYGFSPEQAANAIIVAAKAEPIKYACCIVLATTKLSVNKKVRELLGAGKTSFASAEQALNLTGMQIGGVTPFGLELIPIYIDSVVLNNREVVMGGGNRATKILLDPHQLKKLPNSQVFEELATAR